METQHAVQSISDGALPVFTDSSPSLFHRAALFQGRLGALQICHPISPVSASASAVSFVSLPFLFWLGLTLLVLPNPPPVENPPDLLE